MRASTGRGVRSFRFSRAGQVHASATDLENMSSSALSGAPAGTTFITVQIEQQVHHYLSVPDSAAAEGVAFRVAQAMSSRSTEVDQLPVEVAAVPVLVQARFAVGTDPFPDTQVGAEFTTLSKVIGNTLMDGDWVAAVVRPSSRAEPKRQAKWLDFFQMRTHHSRKSGAVVVSFYAGSRDAGRGADVLAQMVRAIPGFGLSTVARAITPRREVLRWLLLAAIGAAFAAAGLFLDLPAPVTDSWEKVRGLWWVGAVLAAGGIAGSVLTGMWVLPSRAKQVRAALGWGLLPAPAHRLLAPGKPRAASDKHVRQKDGSMTVQHIEASSGDYPLHVDTFLVGSHIPLELVAPFSSQSGQARSGERVVPSELLESRGPVVGTSSSGEKVCLPVEQMYGGLGLLGMPGSGKSALMESIWGDVASTRVNGAPTGQAWPTHNVMIGFDTKPDRQATKQYQAWSEHAHDDVVVIDVFDRAPQVGLNMFPDYGDGAAAWGRRVAAAFRYAYSNEFMSRSFDTVSRVFAAAKMITPEVVARVSDVYDVRVDGSPFYYADILLTNHGDDVGVELARALREHADHAHNSGDASYAGVNEWLGSLYGSGVSAAKRRDLAEAPRTKVAKLMIAEPFLSVAKPLTWEQILNNEMAVIVNLGKTAGGFLGDEEIRQDMAGLMMYTLWEEVQRNCDGWFELSKAVWLFSDEFKHLAAHSAEVAKAMRQDGRSFGVRQIFATQEPGTLPPDVLKVFIGFAMMLYFAQDEPSTLSTIVGDLLAGGGEWEASDVANLADFQAIARVRAGSGRLEPFTVTTLNFRAIRDGRAA